MVDDVGIKGSSALWRGSGCARSSPRLARFVVEKHETLKKQICSLVLSPVEAQERLKNIFDGKERNLSSNFTALDRQLDYAKFVSDRFAN